MPDEKPQAVTLEGPVEIRITNELLPFLQTLMDPQGNPVVGAAAGSGSALSDIEVKGQTPAGVKRIVRLDEQYLMRNRPYEPYRSVVALTLTGVMQTLYTCPANSIAKVEIYFGVTAGVGGSISLRVKGRVMYESVAMREGGVGPRTRTILAAGEMAEAYRPAGVGGLTAYADVELYSTGDVNTGV